MRAKLANFLERTAVTRALSGRSRRMSVNLAARPEGMPEKPMYTRGRPGVLPEKSEDYLGKSADMRKKPGDKLDKSEHMRKKSGDMRKKPGDKLDKYEHMQKKSADMQRKSADMRKKSADHSGKPGDYWARSADSPTRQGNIRSMCSAMRPMPEQRASIFNVRAQRNRANALMWACMAHAAGLLRRPFHALEAWGRAGAARCEQGRMEYDVLTVYVHAEEDIEHGWPYGHVEETALSRSLSVFLEQSRSYERHVAIAILLVFAHELFRLLSTVARKEFTWLLPLHSLAACTPRCPRPPPAWAAPRSVR